MEYAVVVGKDGEAARLLRDLVGRLPPRVLIVMGTHARTGVSRMIWGNRAEEVVRTAPCAVLVVKDAPTPSPSE